MPATLAILRIYYEALDFGDGSPIYTLGTTADTLTQARKIAKHDAKTHDRILSGYSWRREAKLFK